IDGSTSTVCVRPFTFNVMLLMMKNSLRETLPAMQARPYVSATVLLFLDCDLVQSHRFRPIVLDLHDVLFLVVGDLGEGRQLALALSFLGDHNLGEGKRIIDRSGLIADFPKAH